MSGRFTRGAIAAVALMFAITACVADPPGPPPPATDTDGDGLVDSVETNTGVYVGPGDTGTDPEVADTDGDAIADGDEVLGTADGLALPAMGTNPLKKDILLELDWFDDDAEPSVCGAHSHRPTPAAIDRAVEAFASSPVTNPDGSTGVNLIADYGQGGAFTGGNLIPDADGLLDGDLGGADFAALKSANFAANRAGYVHYVLNVHRFNLTSNSSGQAETPGDDMLISLRCFVTEADAVNDIGNTITHELGHNLGLGHGGDEDLNFKPNYNSVMNYRYQFAGVDTDCDGVGDGVNTFSRGLLPPLDEYNLVEADGICGPGGPAIDWNWNGIIDPGTVPVSINGDGVGDILHDHDDWSALDFGGISTGTAQRRSAPEIVTEVDLPD